MSLIFQTYADINGNGLVRKSNSSWATARGSSVGDTLTTSEANPKTSTEYMIFRGFFPFDTTSLPIGAKLISGTIRFWFDNQSLEDADSDSIHIVQTTQSSGTNLALSDFGRVSFVSGGSLPLTSINSGQNVISFNATGLGFINAGGWSKLGLIMGTDLNNITPTGTNNVNAIRSSSTDKGDESKPLLTLVYSTGGNRGYIF